MFVSFIFLRFYLLVFRKRGREGKREGEKHHCVVAVHAPPARDLACNPGALTGNWTSDPLIHRPALNPLSHTNQGYVCIF